MRLTPTLALAQQLVRLPSITPEDAGCQKLIAERLEKIGFHVERLDYGDVVNLWARKGTQRPLFVFAGHTDVVPTGPIEQWEIPPFDAVIKEGRLHGRGTADMKGSIAAFVVACEQFVAQSPHHTGSIGLLITSDEEGPARYGTRAVMQTLNQRQEQIDMCLVGEPSSTSQLGDVIKVGRRGSLNGKLTVKGKQGHVAYPHLADNPTHRALAALKELVDIEWDTGNEHFQPTSLQISNLSAGTGAHNVIPGEMEILFNLRFSPETTVSDIQQTVANLLKRHQLEYLIEWHSSGEPFQTRPGKLVDTVVRCVTDVTGHPPALSTSGGTSDGRFIAPTGAQVVELGPVNATIHQVNEQVSVDDLNQLTLCYQAVLTQLLGSNHFS